MRLSQLFGRTLRTAPADAEMISHQLLIRAACVRPLAAGIYTFLPLGYRVLRKIEAIMIAEMEAIGGQQLWMPHLNPAAVWEATGRWHTFGPALMRVKAQGERDYALAPTHEEVVVDLALREVESYRDLPKLIFHISKKFRDEPRARGGLIRLREFIMKDAYSLDVDEAALDAFYPQMVQAYLNIFARCQIDITPVEADVGAMGGTSSHEFVVPHPQGEDLFIACQGCDYAANVEAALFARDGQPPAGLAPLVKVATPDCKTIAAVADFVGVPTRQTLKAVFYWFTPAGAAAADGRFVFALIRGDLEINETKLGNLLGGGTLRPATDPEIDAVGAAPGYASAIGLAVAPALDQPGLLVVADASLTAGGNYVVGANETGFHYSGANYPRDFTVTLIKDIAQADSGHRCAICGGRLLAQRAIEAGHCFKLGTRYSLAVGATYLAEGGRPQPIFMGSYGIGLDRLMAIIVEQHHDADGIVWPAAVAPYQIHLMHVGKGDDVRAAADELYNRLRDQNWEVLYDDREASAGVKFKDADLIGIPLRLAVGARGLAENSVELKWRRQADRTMIPLPDLALYLRTHWPPA